MAALTRAARAAALALALALCLPLSGCGGRARPEPPAQPASAPVVVYVLADFSPPEELAFARLSELFSRGEGGRVRVELRAPSDYPPSETAPRPAAGGAASEGATGAAAGVPATEDASPDPVAQAVPRASRAREAPQIAVVGEAGFAALRDAYRVEPLGGSTGAALARALLPPARKAAGAGGPGEAAGLAALPLDLDVDVLYVRRGLLYRPPASWQDVVGVARRSTSGGQEAGPVAVGEGDPAPVAALALLGITPGASEAPPSVAPTAPAPADLAGPPGQAAVAWLRAAQAAGDVRFVADPAAAFASAETGLALAPASRLGPLEAALDGHAAFVVSRLPGLPASARFAVPLPYGPRAAREAAARFLAFLARPASQSFWAVETGRLPAVADAYGTDAWKAYLGHHPEVAVMEDAVRTAPAWPPELVPSAPAAARALLAALLAEGAARPPRMGR